MPRVLGIDIRTEEVRYRYVIFMVLDRLFEVCEKAKLTLT